MADVDHLYSLPLEDFIGGRAAAAKEIRKAGDRDTAAVVAKLPKPTPAAWTANQVAREQPELIEAMLEAGAELRAAQEAAVSGGGGQGLRDATLAERRAVDAVMTAAMAYRPAGRTLSRAMADRLRTTLHAAATDEALRDALAAGRLVDEAQAGGAWPFALEPAPREEKQRAAKGRAKRAGDGTTPSADTASTGGATAKRGAAKGAGEAAGAEKRGAAKTADDGGDAATKRAAAQARADEAAAAKAAEAERAAAAAREALEDELREARMSLRVRERVFAGAQEDAGGAKDAVNQARAALEQAQKAAEDAVAEAEAAERVLDQARTALDEARDAVARLEEKLD
ncbi:hypothetical protein OM076_41205 [Solirubrobacter ginsenosidimutans]|uniref:Uncharacterized protein n=1 Tax=Solirubrobacter ginsenosidimutans TaxID=490573 RepID=A0A9X3N1X6_9ACTN|nr:hypothetical protein [Solirubrobacter ginsenosidimutans]MDA0166752.1 hypothetical protein [Solirubrobacter ginsenosidimutans]